jgi:hypothetical protein
MMRIKACPFCGEPPIFTEQVFAGYTQYGIDCVYDHCLVPCHSGWYKSKDEASKAWNIRDGDSMIDGVPKQIAKMTIKDIYNKSGIDLTELITKEIKPIFPDS